MLKAEKIPFSDLGIFSKIFLDYIGGDKVLSPFYHARPSPEGFMEVLRKRNFTKDRREILSNVLLEQYAKLSIHDPVGHNIEILKSENTFTVVTGHQLNIFTGPLFFIFKIVTVINACKVLKDQYPEYNFVPVYWMASEDHDFEEIQHVQIEGSNYRWDADQSGAVGRFNLDGLEKILDEIPGIPEYFKEAYTKCGTLAEATRYYVNELFGEYGLVTIDGDHPVLKGQFSGVMAEEILNPHSEELVNGTNEALTDLGYKSQAFTRPINFFYLDEEGRNRIEKKNESWQVIGRDITWNEAELQEKISRNPELFSPNVILRPVYQETILPNIGYVGGPAEMAYWLQLKSLFDHHNVSFPVLLPRNFGMIISKNISRKLEKTGLAYLEAFTRKEDLRISTLNGLANDHHLDKEKAALNDLGNKIKARVSTIDPTLQDYVGATFSRIEKEIQRVEHKSRLALERKHEEIFRQIDDIRQWLYPNDTLQERYYNVMEFMREEPEIVGELLRNFDPFDLSFHVLWSK